MKNRTIAVLLAAMVTIPAMAQRENRVYEYDEFGQLGRGEGWARRFAHNIVDGFLGAEYYVEQDDEDEKTLFSLDNGSASFEVKRKHFGPGHTPDTYIGLNMLTDYQSFDDASGLPQRGGKGFEWGFAMGQWGYYFNQFAGVNTAIYLTRSRYWLARDSYLDWRKDELDDSWKLDVINGSYNGESVKQGYLRYWSLRVPFCVEFGASHKKGPFIAFGPEIEYRFGDVSKVKLANGDKVKPTKDLNLNPLGANAILRVGINNFGILARYSFTELFNESSPVECYPLMIGISSSF